MPCNFGAKARYSAFVFYIALPLFVWSIQDLWSTCHGQLLFPRLRYKLIQNLRFTFSPVQLGHRAFGSRRCCPIGSKHFMFFVSRPVMSPMQSYKLYFMTFLEIFWLCRKEENKWVVLYGTKPKLGLPRRNNQFWFTSVSHSILTCIASLWSCCCSHAMPEMAFAQQSLSWGNAG